MKDLTCAAIADSPLSFPWGFDEEDEDCAELKRLLWNRISSLIADGVRSFSVVLDPGFGLYAAEMVNRLRGADPSVELYCYIPFEELAVQWPPELRERFFRAAALSTEADTVSPHRTDDCTLEAYFRAVDDADMVLTVSRGKMKGIEQAAALKYARRVGKNIIPIGQNTEEKYG